MDGGCPLVSGYLAGGEAATWAIAGCVRDVMRCGAMQSAATVGVAPNCRRSFRLGGDEKNTMHPISHTNNECAREARESLPEAGEAEPQDDHSTRGRRRREEPCCLLAPVKSESGV